MKIAVLVKIVPDTQAVLKIGEDRRYINPADVNFVLNPYDEYALEEALRIRERFGGTVKVISLGGEDAVKALRNALAMGADEAVHIQSPGGLDILGVAHALADQLKTCNYDLIFAGKQAVDDDCAAIGPMVAVMMDIPCVTHTVSLEIAENSATAVREYEGGQEVYKVPLPALITAEKGLNEPRYASLKGIMMAKKKSITVVQAAPRPAKTEVVNLNYPPTRPPGKIIGQGVEAVDELIRLLREEAKVL